MKVDPFIEAEKIAGHSVTKTLWPVRGLPVRLLRAQQRRPLGPRLTDAELTEKIKAIHAESKGTYGVPAGPPGAAPSQASPAASDG